MKCMPVGFKYMHFIPPTPPIHLEFSSSLSKRKELIPRDISKNSSVVIARE
jgi:hypothetical protein